MHLHLVHIIFGLIALGLSLGAYWVFRRRYQALGIGAGILVFLFFRTFFFDKYDWTIWRPLSFGWFLLAVVMMALLVFGLLRVQLLAFVAMLVLVGLFLTNLNHSFMSYGDDVRSAKKNPTTTTASVTTTTSIPKRSAAECIGGHNVALDPNKGKKVISDGLAGLTTPAKQAKVLKTAAHDPRVLMLYWNMVPAGKAHPVHRFEELMAGGCYNQLGIDRYQQLNGILMNADWRPAIVPADATNTGVTPGGQPFQVRETRGITGNKKGTLVTILDAAGKPVLQFWVLDRCANIAAKGTIPNIPPPPPSHPTTTTTTREHGKDATKSHLNNPHVPDVVKGCTGTGSTPSGTAPCPGNTGGTYNQGDDTSAHPGPTGCGGRNGNPSATCPTLPLPTTTVGQHGPPETTPTTVKPQPIPTTVPAG